MLLYTAFGGAFGLPTLALLVRELLVAFGVDDLSPFKPIYGMFFSGEYFLFLAVMGLLGMAANAVSWPWSRPATIRVDDAGMAILRGNQQELIARSDIEGGLVLPNEPRPSVVLYLRNGDVLTVEVQNEAAAHRVLGRLGIDPEHRRVSVPLGNANRQLAVGCAVAPVMFFLGLVLTGFMLAEKMKYGPVLCMVASALVTLFAFWAARPSEVVVGSDGVRVRRRLFDHWIAASTIESVEEEVVKDGTALSLRVKEEKGTKTVHVVTGDHELITALGTRIRGAMASAKGESGALVGELLEPHGRPFAEWRAELGKVFASKAADYRRVAIAPDDLLAVMENPELPPGRRIGAAMALRIAEHPEARARIRVAAEACADDDVRQALEEAAEGEIDDRTLRRALH